MHLTGPRQPQSISVASFVANLPELLLAMRSDPRVVVAIADFSDYRYVQFWAEDDLVIAEVISNFNVPNHDALTTAQEDQLRAAGWQEPVSYRRPNWRLEAVAPVEVLEVAQRTADAVVRILGQGATTTLAEVELQTFAMSSSRRSDEGTSRRRLQVIAGEMGALADEHSEDRERRADTQQPDTSLESGPEVD